MNALEAELLRQLQALTGMDPVWSTDSTAAFTMEGVFSCGMAPASALPKNP